MGKMYRGSGTAVGKIIPRPGHSTGAALASLTHPWHCAIDIGQIVCAIYLDLKRAFDTVAIFYTSL